MCDRLQKQDDIMSKNKRGLGLVTADSQSPFSRLLTLSHPPLTCTVVVGNHLPSSSPPCLLLPSISVDGSLCLPLFIAYCLVLTISYSSHLSSLEVPLRYAATPALASYTMHQQSYPILSLLLPCHLLMLTLAK